MIISNFRNTSGCGIDHLLGKLTNILNNCLENYYLHFQTHRYRNLHQAEIDSFSFQSSFGSNLSSGIPLIVTMNRGTSARSHPEKITIAWNCNEAVEWSWPITTAATPKCVFTDQLVKYPICNPNLVCVIPSSFKCQKSG